MVYTGIYNHLVLDTGLLERIGYGFTLLSGYEEVVLANEVTNARACVLDARGECQRRLRLAHFNIRVGQPTGVEDGAGGQVQLSRGEISDMPSYAESQKPNLSPAVGALSEKLQCRLHVLQNVVTA
jgi:hypothetical protein